MCIKNAEKGKYAIGAFNVYNLEGIEAVVAAAEEERSPAILQVPTYFFCFPFQMSLSCGSYYMLGYL